MALATLAFLFEPGVDGARLFFAAGVGVPADEDGSASASATVLEAFVGDLVTVTP